MKEQRGAEKPPGRLLLLASLIGFVLTRVADPEHRGVSIAVGVAYTVLAVASIVDARSRNGAGTTHSQRRYPE